VRASYAKGFKAPTLNELFFPPAFGCPAFGNPDLKPERSWELNAGFDQSLFGDRMKISGTYFHREVKDMIEGRPIPNDPFGCFRAFNVGTARFDGVEWNLAWKILSFLGFNANYTYLDWDTDAGSTPRGVLPRRPRHRGSVGFNYNYEAFEANLTTLIVGGRDDFHSSKFNIVHLPAYGRVDLAAAYHLPVNFDLVKTLALFFKAENLFSSRYEEAHGFRARPFNFLIGLQGVFGKK
jgi:outer membrane cobalamin receptor